jgi:hypothetical protein
MMENDWKSEKLVNEKNKVCQSIYDRGYKIGKARRRKTLVIF